MKIFNRLANREFLMVVAIIASAITLHVRQHVLAGSETQATPASSTAGRICEPTADDSGTARILPADCSIRATVRPVHPNGIWV